VRRRDFVLPNYVARVRFLATGKEEYRLLYGVDVPTVERRIKERYKHVQVVSVTAYDFAGGWGKKAADKLAEVTAAMAAGQKYDFNKNGIWGDLKDFLFDLFDGNCAYCECDLLEGSFGAVEHYRPKNAVVGEAGHLGYFWLAYEPSNYLPTCTRCNTSKSNKFPLAPGSPRAAAPGDEASEQPLLLNSYRLGLDLSVDLQFVSANPTKIGPVVKGVSAQGIASVDLLDLNRPDVIPQRLKEQESAVGNYLLQRATGSNPPPILERLKAGTVPFAAAALAAVVSIEQGFPSLGG